MKKQTGCSDDKSPFRRRIVGRYPMKRCQSRQLVLGSQFCILQNAGIRPFFSSLGNYEGNGQINPLFSLER